MSSLGGSSRSGNRSRIAATVSSVSSTDSVGLGEPGHLGRVAHHDAGDVGGALHQLDVLGRLAGGALDLLVALVADQQDVVVVIGEPPGLVVHLGHQRAGGVDGLQAALGRLRVHRRRDAVGGEHHGLALRHLVELLDEDRTARLEVGHDVLVVHDLLAHVDRRAVEVQRLLDRDHRPVDAGAVAARRREQHGAVRRCAGIPRSVRGPRIGSESSARPVAADGASWLSSPWPTLAGHGAGDLPAVAGARPPDRHRDRELGRAAGRCLGRGSGRPGQPPPRRRHGVPHPARLRGRHLGAGDLPAHPLRRPQPAAGRGRERRRARQAVLLRQPRHPLARRPRDPAGRPRRAAGPARATPSAARRRGSVRRRAQAAAALPARAASAWSPPRTPPPSATSSRTPAGGGPRSPSRRRTPPCRAPARPPR